MSTNRAAIMAVAFFVAIGIYQYIRSCWFPKIPPTTGRYECIGIRYLRVTPYLRCKILYPADPIATAKGKYPKSQYLTDPDIVISSFARVTNSGAWRIQHIQNSNGTCFTDAPLLKGKQKYPTVVYSHGLGANFDVCAAVCIDIASHGKIVVCIEHGDGSASCTRLGNGSVLFWDGFRAKQTLDGPFEPDSQDHVSAIRKFRAPQLLHRVTELRTVLSHMSAAVFESEYGRLPTSQCNSRSGSSSPPATPVVLQLRKGPLLQLPPIKIPGSETPPNFLVGTFSPTPTPTAATQSDSSRSSSCDCHTSCIHSPRLPTRLKSRSNLESAMEGQRDIYNHYLKLPSDLSRHVDLSNVVLMGHSFGGATVITAAGDADLRGNCGISAQDGMDKVVLKIRGVIAHDPWMQILSEKLLKSGLSIPLLTIFSEEFMKWSANMMNIKSFAGLSPGSVWMYIKGTKHWSFTDIVFWFEWYFVYFSGTSGASSPYKALHKIRKLDADFVEEVVQKPKC